MGGNIKPRLNEWTIDDQQSSALMFLQPFLQRERNAYPNHIHHEDGGLEIHGVLLSEFTKD